MRAQVYAPEKSARMQAKQQGALRQAGFEQVFVGAVISAADGPQAVEHRGAGLGDRVGVGDTRATFRADGYTQALGNFFDASVKAPVGLGWRAWAADRQ
jgi:hypothetical protein